MTEKWRTSGQPQGPTEADLAAERERFEFIHSCTAAELHLILPSLMTDPLGFDQLRAQIEQARAGATS